MVLTPLPRLNHIHLLRETPNILFNNRLIGADDDDDDSSDDDGDGHGDDDNYTTMMYPYVAFFAS